MYLRWRRLLPRWIEILPVELPGRGSRMGERFVDNFDELIGRLCDEQASTLQGNFALFGHSMGALLAYGITQRLRKLGRPLPRALLVSGSAAHSRRDPARLPDVLDDAALTAELRKQGGTPDEVFASAELMRITLNTLAADYRVCKSFVPMVDPLLPLPVHVFAGRQDDIAVDGIEAWAEQAGEAFTLDWFDGGHFFLRHQEGLFVEALTQRLQQCVAGGWHEPHAFA